MRVRQRSAQEVEERIGIEKHVQRRRHARKNIWPERECAADIEKFRGLLFPRLKMRDSGLGPEMVEYSDLADDLPKITIPVEVHVIGVLVIIGRVTARVSMCAELATE